MWNQHQPPGGPCAGRRRVRVWFGSHVIAEYKAVPQLAARYEDAMRRRFAGLRVTSEELAGDHQAGDAIRPLPSERLWELTP
ncbi:MAG: hypothetical protein ACRCYQ_12050 [Nocardioides sp.]